MAGAKKKNPPERDLALQCRRGEWERAWPELCALSEGGNGAAAVIACEVSGALGDWEACVTHGARYLKDPSVGLTGNLFTDATRLVRRAAVRELKNEALLSPVAASIPERWHPMRDATLLKDLVLPSAAPGPANRAAYEQAVDDAQRHKRFKGKPVDLARHCYALAHAFKVEDEVLRRYEEDDSWAWFDQHLEVARIVARRGDEVRAWGLLSARLASWFPMDALQVFPVELLVDPWLSPLMTLERCRFVLCLPRGDGAG